MFFPEFLYQLSKRDQQVTWLDPRFAQESASAAALGATVEVLQVPDGQCFILQTFFAEAIPGLAQGVTRILLELIPPTGGLTQRIAGAHWTPAVANQTRETQFSGSLLIPPGWRLQARGGYDAGAAANTITGDVNGIFIPVGNVQRL